MKRTSALILSLLICMLCSFTVFAENIFIIEDGEDEFVVDAQTTTTTTQPAETTSGATQFEDIINGGSLEGYFDSFKDMFVEGVDSLINDLDSWADIETTTAAVQEESALGLPSIDAGQYVPVTQAAVMTTNSSDLNVGVQPTEQISGEKNKQEELPSVLIIDNSNDDSWGVSGSTLTLLVFIAAVVILVLVIVIVLIIMTRKTDFDSAVKNRTTLPDVDQPDSLAWFIEGGDDTPDDSDDNDYSDITYWDDE